MKLPQDGLSPLPLHSRKLSLSSLWPPSQAEKPRSTDGWLSPPSPGCGLHTNGRSFALSFLISWASKQGCLCSFTWPLHPVSLSSLRTQHSFRYLWLCVKWSQTWWLNTGHAGMAEHHSFSIVLSKWLLGLS